MRRTLIKTFKFLKISRNRSKILTRISFDQLHLKEFPLVKDITLSYFKIQGKISNPSKEKKILVNHNGV